MKDLGRDLTSSVMSQIANISGFRVPIVYSPFVFVFSQALKNVKAILSPWVGSGQLTSLQNPSLGVHQRNTTTQIAWNGMKYWLLGPYPGVYGTENQKSVIFNKLLLPSHTSRNGRTAHNIWAPMKSFLKSWSSKGIILSLLGRPSPRVPLRTSTYRCNNQAEPPLKVLFRLSFYDD